jgi:hypothetical protein
MKFLLTQVNKRIRRGLFLLVLEAVQGCAWRSETPGSGVGGDNKALVTAFVANAQY